MCQLVGDPGSDNSIAFPGPGEVNFVLVPGHQNVTQQGIS